MTTIHVGPPRAVLQHIEDLKARIALLPSGIDTTLHTRSLAALQDLVGHSKNASTPVALAASSGTITAEKVAAHLGGGPDLAAAIRRATSGRPYWRLVSQAKSVKCPRCKVSHGEACIGKSSCPERAWALAAQQRQVRANPADFSLCLERLATCPEDPALIDLAINTGVIRLERVPGSDTDVQWVDAV